MIPAASSDHRDHWDKTSGSGRSVALLPGLIARRCTASRRAGPEPAVLCVHGYCQSSAYWAPTLGRLALTDVSNT